MELNVASYGFGFLAGVLSTLSPCVLPIVPILLGTAINTHTKAPLVLAGGLAISYSVIGTTVAWVGGNLGFDASMFRNVGALALALIGVLLLSATLQQKLAGVTSGVSDVGNSLLYRWKLEGLWGQFAIGLILGIVWSPCVGPTLGAAIVLASEGSQLAHAATLMSIFGIGAALPIIVLGQVSRAAIGRWRNQMIQVGQTGKFLLGLSMLIIAAMVFTGGDKTFETWLVNLSPDWLTELTTKF
jgi:cytochrome c-type biogenesis protein